MFEAWNIVDNLLSRETAGHYLWEPKLLTEELQRRGATVRIFGHRSIKAEDFPGAVVVPAFALHHEASVSQDREWGALENFVVHNLEYRKALNRLDPDVFNDALMLLLDVSHRQLLGTIRWCSGFDSSKRPDVAIILMGQTDWSRRNPGLDLFHRVWKGCPPAVSRHLKLCTRSEMSADKYEPIFGVRPHVLPSALGPTDREITDSRKRASQTGPMVVSFLAGARVERGAALIPEVVKQCAPLGACFLIQVNDVIGMADEKVAALKALGDRPEVRFREGTLPREEYNDWIARSVVLLPYDAGRYQSRSSGVYLEARCFGSPLIVPSGSWMADEVARLGNGLVFEEYNAASIVRCIARAQADLAGLRQRAAACADDYRREHGADRCVEALEALFNEPEDDQ